MAVAPGVPMGDLDDLLADFMALELEDEQTELQTLARLPSLSRQHKYQPRTVLDGDRIMEDIIRTLDEFSDGVRPLQRHVLQYQFHHEMICCILKTVYGDQFELHRDRILSSYGMDPRTTKTEMMQQLLITTARRMGKTYAVAMMIAALLICFPRCTIVCFSSGLRVAMNMVTLVTQLVSNHDRGSEMVSYGTRQDQLTLRTGRNDKRVFSAFPANSKVSM